MKQLVDVVQSVAMFGLVTFGIIGLVWRTVKEDGWLGTVVDKLMNAIIDHPVVMIPLLIAIAFVGKLWHDHQVETGHASKIPNFFLYGVMVAGAYFFFSFVTTGSL